MTNQKSPKITWQELAFWYLRSVMHKMLPKNQKEIDEYLKREDDDHLNKLLFGLSVIYDTNGMHHILTSDKYVWELETVNIENVFMDGFDTWEITELLRTKKINYNFPNLVQYLKSNTKLAKKYHYLLTPKPVDKDMRLFGIVENGQVRILDGGHRILNSIINGEKEINMYVFDKANSPTRANKGLVPSSLFFWIRNMIYRLNLRDLRKANVFIDQVDKAYNDPSNAKEDYFFKRIGTTEEEKVFMDRMRKILDNKK